MELILDQLAGRVRAAAEQGRPLRIRGGGSKDFYGEQLQGELLETGELAGIISYEPTELVVTARAGTPLAQLETLLAEHYQCLPFEPPHFGSRSEPSAAPLEGGARGGGQHDSGSAAGSEATVGGMVATGLSGPARASAGAVRDYVLGLTMINGRGEVLTFGGQVMKNVAGYDVSRLVAGSLGTLGLIAEVSLKVLPIAPAEATLKFELNQADALLRLNEWGGKPLPLNASCWLEESAGPVLYLRLRGAVAAVEAACRSLGGERQTSANVAAEWAALRDQRLPWFTERGQRDLWRLSVPQTAPVLDLPETPLVEWHGGERWVRAERGAAARLRAAALRAGGHATLFWPGEGTAPASGRFTPLPAPLDRIHRELKRQFDPAGIFNRGRLVADF